VTDDAREPGLHTPAGAVAALEHPRRFTPGRVAVQVLGAIISLGLFGWAIALALSEENRESLGALRHAPAFDVAALIGLTALSHVTNAAVFGLVLRPLRRLPWWEIALVNAVCTLLVLFPFKLSILVRVLIHHRRDRIPFRELVAWFAAVGALGLAVLGPLAFATLWRREFDAWFIVAGFGGMAACSAGGWWLCTLAPRYPILRRLSLGGDELIRRPGVVVAHLVTRVADVLVLAARVYFAARVAAVAIDADSAFLLASGYFLATVLAFAGSLGFAEMGTAGVAELIGLEGKSFALVALIVTATQTVLAAALSIVAVLVLRLDRVLIPGRRPAPVSPDA
jgi:hypothetical protein